MPRCPSVPISQGFNPGHPAIDYAVPIGTPIYAPINGTVRIVSLRGSYGKHLYLTSGVITYLYAHLSAFAVGDKQRVAMGQLLGQTGNTGNVRGRTGAHLHYEVRYAGAHVNPLSYACPFQRRYGPSDVVNPPPQNELRQLLEREASRGNARASVRRFEIRCARPGKTGVDLPNLPDLPGPLPNLPNLPAFQFTNPLDALGFIGCIITDVNFWIRALFVVFGSLALLNGARLVTNTVAPNLIPKIPTGVKLA